MSVPSVSPADVPGDAFLLDVREGDEWAAGRITGSVHVPMNTIPARSDEVPREGDVVVVCRVGARSAQVAAYLRQLGWTNVRNLDGGVEAWAAGGRPFEGTVV